MDTLLDTQLQRMETALDALLQSIITYNPSVTAADALLQADDELSKGLEQLTRHQNNYIRILQLREEAELLDSQIKSSVQLLAEVRKELLAVPLDTSKENTRPVPYKELLAYAKNISPFTIPAAFRPKPAAPASTSSDDKQCSATATTAMAEINDHAIANTPAVEGESRTQEDGDSRTINVLNEEQRAWIADLNNLPFQPWPGEQEMALGALHVLNHQVINGNDPTDITRIIEDERVAKEEAKRKTEEEEKKKFAGSRPVASGASGPTVAQSTVSESGRGGGARFGLEDSDDSDDD
ncbi:uncharacterized protein PV09_03413 [Verruconis gallopava]|uniref:Mediator of RNA polymerase II transcription subunit 4 n=1 Tax=Verruconis gallopava TaxID=253628 RepID=A0A0D2AF04_9PEZI|nr:uncharacterized protein PV09_03413 [Verruconis gallopava]KIW05533.1 hypothetical protein PV09_03413 [Verruconis gallopava]